MRSRRLSQHNNGHGRPHENFDPSGFEDKWRRYNAWDNRTETQPASVPSDAALDIKISYQDSSEETQTKDEAYGTSMEPLTGYALANEEEYRVKDDDESPDATSSEPLTGYVLANEEDYLAKEQSDCEDNEQDE